LAWIPLFMLLDEEVNWDCEELMPDVLATLFCDRFIELLIMVASELDDVLLFKTVVALALLVPTVLGKPGFCGFVNCGMGGTTAVAVADDTGFPADE
jgi:hypothetical protein